MKTFGLILLACVADASHLRAARALQAVGVTGIEVIDETTNTVFAQITQGATLPFTGMPATISVQMIVAGSTVKSVKSELTDFKGKVRSKTDKKAPYYYKRNKAKNKVFKKEGTYSFFVEALDDNGDPVGSSIQATFDVMDNVFDPGADPGTWTEASTIGSGTLRHEHGFVECAGKFFALGGRELRVGDVYDPATNTWQNLASLELNGISHFQPTCVNGVVYIINGLIGDYPDEIPTSSVLTVDATAASPSISTGDVIPAARRRGSSGCAVYQNCIYIVSGIQNGHMSGTVTYFDRYCPGDPSPWTVMPAEPQVAKDHGGAAVLDDTLYFAGGRVSRLKEDGGLILIDTVECYSFISGTWQTVAPLPTVRAGVVVTAYRGLIFVIGGETRTQQKSHSEVEAYYPVTNQWYTMTRVSTQRHGLTGFVYDDKLWVQGGSKKRGPVPETNSMEYFQLPSI